MKKLVFLFTILSSFLIFYTGFQIYSDRQYQQLLNLQRSIALEHNQEVLSLEFNFSDNREYFFNELNSFFDHYNYTGIIHHSSKNNELEKTHFIFLYTKKSLTNLPFFKTENNVTIDFSKPTNKYFSSEINDKNKSDTLQFLNPIYYKSYQEIIQIRQFSSFDEIAKHKTDMLLFIICDNKKETYQEIKLSKLGNYLAHEYKNSDINDETETDFYSPIDTNQSITLLLLVSISLLLIIFCEILSNKKEIIIRKLQGMSELYIFRKLYLKIIIKIVLVYIFVTCICYYLFFSSFINIQIPFLLYLTKMLLIFIGLLSIVSCCSYLIIRTLRSHINLKKNSNFNWAERASILIKIGAISLILPSLYLSSTAGTQGIQKYIELLQNCNVLSNNLFVEAMSEGEIPIQDIEPLIYSYMQKNGAIYQDFNQNFKNEILHQSYPQDVPLFEHQFIIVNQNYLSNYSIMTADNNVLSIDKLKDHSVLIPESYKDIDVRQYAPLCQSIIYVKNDNSYINRYPLILDNQPRFVKDPIIEVRTILDEELSWNGEYLVLTYTQKNLNNLRSYLKEVGLEHQIVLDTSKELFDKVVEKNRDECITLMFILLIYIMLIISFMYQNIFLYFFKNKQLIALNYLSGKNFFQRYISLISEDLFVYSICFAIGFWLLKLSFTFMIIFILSSIVVELLMMKLMIKQFERRNMINILKGK